MFITAQIAFDNAAEKYTEAVALMAVLEEKRRMLIGAGESRERIISTIKSMLPMIAKLAAAASGGGGIAALLADPGAFAGILSSIKGIFGG